MAVRHRGFLTALAAWAMAAPSGLRWQLGAALVAWAWSAHLHMARMVVMGPHDMSGRSRWHGNTTPWFGGGIGGLGYGGSLGAQVAVEGSIGGLGMAGHISVSSKGPAGSGWNSGGSALWLGGGIGGLGYGGSLGALVAVGGAFGSLGMGGSNSFFTNGPTGRGGFDGGSESGYGGGVGGLGYGSPSGLWRQTAEIWWLGHRCHHQRTLVGPQGPAGIWVFRHCRFVVGLWWWHRRLGLWRLPWGSGGSRGPLVAWAQEAPLAQPRMARVGLQGSGVSALAVRRRGMVAVSAAWALAASSGLWGSRGCHWWLGLGGHHPRIRAVSADFAIF